MTTRQPTNNRSFKSYEQGLKKKSPKLSWAIGGGVVATLIVIGALGSIASKPSTTSPAAQATTMTSPVAHNPVTAAPLTTTPAPLPPAPATPGVHKDGTFLVGKELTPGTYRTDGGSGCYWARLSGLTGDLEDILSNNFGGGQQVVTILPSDKAFKTNSCGSWELVN
jgi:hypothetical protein